MRELLDEIVHATRIPARYLTAGNGGSAAEAEAEARAKARAMDEYLHVIRWRFYHRLERRMQWRMLLMRGAIHRLSKPRRGPYRRRVGSTRKRTS